MKILHIIPSFGIGGMEKVICSIINSTSKKYNHELLSLDKNREAIKWIKDDSIVCIEFYKSGIRHVFFRSLYNAIRKTNPQVLMTYNWGATDAIWLGRLCGITKIIHHEHGFGIDETMHLSWKRVLVRFFVYRMASKTVVVSHELLNLMRETFSLSSRKVTFIPNGINSRYYIQKFSDRERIRAELGLKNNDFVVGFSGRLDPVKNFELMIKIFLSCLNKNTNFKFLIIGDGPEKEHIEDLCKDTGMQKYVLLVGQKDEVLPYLRALDAFLLTSYREQMPMTLLEAMSVGIPVVASKVGEIPYMIDHGINGFLVSPNTAPEAWAQILLSVKNDRQYKDIGVFARKKIREKFEEEIMVDSYRNLLENVIRS